MDDDWSVGGGSHDDGGSELPSLAVRALKSSNRVKNKSAYDGQLRPLCIEHCLWGMDRCLR